MTAYYELIKKTTESNGLVISRYKPTMHAQGAWNEHEQHMAPASGLLAAEIEQFSPKENMRYGRLSFDIWGLIDLSEFTIETQVIRPGRTIELIEATLRSGEKTLIVARAWRMLTQDTSTIAGLEDKPTQHPEELPVWHGMKRWSGGYIASIETRKGPQHRAGKGIIWVTNDKAMVKGHKTSDFAHLIGMVDTANGIVPRQQEDFQWAFPNLDLQIHMYRQPQGKWLGLETVQQYGTDGIGLTSSVLHDVHGPFGRSEQILTLRPM